MSPKPTMFFRQTFKVAIAAVVAIVIAQAFALPYPVFALFAIIVVMEPTIMASARAAAARIGGTAVGIAFGATLATIWGQTPLTIGIGLLATIMIAALMRRLDAWKIAGITFCLVMFSPISDPTAFAIIRFGETALGIAIGLAVNRAIWPPRPWRLVRRTIGDALRAIAGIYEAVVFAALTATPPPADMDERKRVVRTMLRELDALWSDARRDANEGRLPDEWEYLLRRVWEDVLTMEHAAADPTAAMLAEPIAAELTALAKTSVSAMEQIARAVATPQPCPPLSAVDDAVDAVTRRLPALSTHAERHYSFMALLQFGALVTSMLSLGRRLPTMRAAIEAKPTPGATA
ncbi:MAG: FUSC family protein [Dehalococcoidia bacterium]|nr:FUSC family protein [Dehalococcoidia bacterium]